LVGLQQALFQQSSEIQGIEIHQSFTVQSFEVTDKDEDFPQTNEI
jgi:hypothetical protein